VRCRKVRYLGGEMIILPIDLSGKTKLTDFQFGAICGLLMAMILIAAFVFFMQPPAEPVTSNPPNIRP
jgi:hypothetical protein